MTNKQKFDYYFAIITQIAFDLANKKWPELPKSYYVLLFNGNIKEHKHIGTGYYFPIYGCEKPTREDVKKVINLYDQILSEQFVFEDNKFFYRYEEKGISSISTGSTPIPELFRNKSYFLDFALVSEASIKRIEVLKAFKDLPGNHTKDVNYNYLANGYIFLGWQNGWKHVYFDEDHNLCSETGKPHITFGYLEADHPYFGKCKRLQHPTIEVQHTRSGSENTVSCPVCKIFWKYDCSD